MTGLLLLLLLLHGCIAAQVYWLSIWQGRATPGSELMNLRYRNEHAMEAAAAAAAGAGGCSGSGGSSAVQPPSRVSGGTVFVFQAVQSASFHVCCACILTC